MEESDKLPSTTQGCSRNISRRDAFIILCGYSWLVTFDATRGSHGCQRLGKTGLRWGGCCWCSPLRAQVSET